MFYRYTKSVFQLSWVLCSALILSACGGGSGGATSTPTATSGSITTNSNTDATGTLTGSDPDGNAITYRIETNGSKGTATITNVNTGEFNYTPNTNTTGDDTFTFRVNNGTNDSNLAAITVHILDITSAQNDSYTVNEGANISTNAASGVLLNDITNPGSSITTSLLTAPLNASAFTFNNDGSFSYTHNGSENFSDSFSYKIVENGIDAGSAIVTINVLAQNDIPVANNNSYGLAENDTLNITANAGLRANASDGDNLISELTVLLVSPPSDATSFILNADGSFTYNHNGSENITDTFTYKINDGTDDSNIATATLTLSPVNDSPVSNDNAYGVLENDTIVVSTGSGLRANATDIDNITSDLSVIIVGFPANAQSFTPNADGSFTYVHNGSETTTDSFAYKINDGLADSNISTATITISPVNDSPVATAGLCQSTPREVVLNGTVSATDADNSSNELMYSLLTNGTKGNVVITDATTGAFTYTPDGTSSGTDTFTFTVTDPFNAQSSTSVRLEIDPKIMPLGDSITAGIIDGVSGLPVNEDRISYRKSLYDSLKADGYNFDFVGSVSSGGSFSGFDPDHEGQRGYTSAEIAFGRVGELSPKGIYEWLGASTAEYILLHIGTNSLTTSESDVENILDEIDRYETDNSKTITVLLAEIIDRNPNDVDVTTFNTNVKNMANGRTLDTITIVDQHAALDYATDMFDLVHPIQAGYTKMANTWLNSIRPLLTKCP